MNAIVPYQNPYAIERWQPRINEVACMDALTYAQHLPDGSVSCCVSSPPYYGLRDYGVDGQIGLEETPDAYITRLVELFREIRRALADDGTCWVNLGDSYAGSNKGVMADGSIVGGEKQQTNKGTMIDGITKDRSGIPDKNLLFIPHRVAIALQADGWIVRNDVVWAKNSVMPESVKDRFTRAHEYVFLLTKNKRYWFDADAVREPHQTDEGKLRDKSNEGYGHAFIKKLGEGHRSWYTPEGRNRRTVWTINPEPFKGAHFAVFPSEIPRICIKAGCPPDGTVYDPFMGSGTVALVARELGRNFYGSELNRDYRDMAMERIRNADPFQATVLENGIVQPSLFAS